VWRYRHQRAASFSPKAREKTMRARDIEDKSRPFGEDPHEETKILRDSSSTDIARAPRSVTSGKLVDDREVFQKGRASTPLIDEIPQVMGEIRWKRAARTSNRSSAPTRTRPCA